MSVVLVPTPLAAANVDRLPEGGETGLSPAEMVTIINAGTIPWKDVSQCLFDIMS